MSEILSPAVDIRQLTRRFGELVAVDNVTVSIERGQIFGLIGPNGVGKSTLMKMLTTLLPPTSGSAFVAGFDITTRPAEVRRRIGYVPQLMSADGSLTGYENLLLSARLYGVRREVIRLYASIVLSPGWGYLTRSTIWSLTIPAE
jgi:ABC-2 type transport system ATP-binding protein